MSSRLGLFLAWLGVGVFIASCSGPDLNPVAVGPSPAGPAVTSLVLSAPSFAFLNETTRVRAVATFPDGREAEIEKAAWLSETPEIAAVDERGRVTSKASGRAIVRAEANGHTARVSFRVIPDYGGFWRGEFEVIRCWSWCGRRGPQLGARPALSLELSQADDEVTGRLNPSFRPGLVRGQIDVAGALRLDGAWDVLYPTYRDYPIYNWLTNIEAPSNAVMSGVFSFSYGNDIVLDTRISLIR